MILSKESQKVFEDICLSLSQLTAPQYAIEDIPKDQVDRVNWDFSTKKSIGGFTCGESIDGVELQLRANPYTAVDTTRSLMVKYKAKSRSTQEYLVYPRTVKDGNSTKKNFGTAKIKWKSTGMVGGHYYITVDNKEYKLGGMGTSKTEGYYTSGKNKIYIKFDIATEKAEYILHSKIIEKGVTDANNLAIPFYAWYKNGNKLWIGVSLEFNGGVTVSGWYNIFTDTKSGVGEIKNTTIIKEDKDEDLKTSKETVSQKDLNEANGIVENNNSGSSDQPLDEITATEIWENSQNGYEESLFAADSQSQLNYWKQLYGTSTPYSLKSHNSIIGLPLQFMSNVDMRVGSSTYGKQYMEDILYDMSIACIKPGGPVLNPNLDEEAKYSDGFISSTLGKVGKLQAYLTSLKTEGTSETLKKYLFSLFKGGSARFYSFMSDYTHYSHYVNTLCHLFITYLNIGDKYYTTGSGVRKKYTFYSDDPSEIETDGGAGLFNQFGWDNAVYMYYSPESQLSHTFSNTTMASGLDSTAREASNAVKEWGFFINAAGIETGRSVVSSYAQSLAANNGGLLGRLFGTAAEGATTVIAGNNLSLPEIYSDSETTVQHTFKVKLASPYGDPESVFLYVLRPLARLLAFSLPRQYGPNSYMSPFIVQAFSKGQFNCQLGIVTNLSITRCGNGGESHTINHIPTELEVTLEIQDMYEKVFLSNEYFGNSAWKSWLGAGIDYITNGLNLNEIGEGVGTTMMQMGTTLTASRLLFNNVGLIDFVASFCGANLNQPTYMSGWTVILNMMKNRSKEYVQYNENDGWKFPQWEKKLNDAYHDAVTNLNSNITTIA